MSKKKIILLIIFLIILSIAAFVLYFSFSDSDKVKENNNETKEELEVTYDDSEVSIEEQVEEVMSGMSLTDKISQMMIISYNNVIYDAQLDSMLQSFQFGGVVFYSYNMTTYDNTLSYITSIKDAFTIPPILAIDYEGGTVSRLQAITDVKATKIPSFQKISSFNDLDKTYNIGKMMAFQLRTLNINTNLSPVVDLENKKDSSLYSRSFGSDPDVVTEQARSLIKGMQDNGVNACLKHFPGLGSSEKDTHKGISVINKSLEELEKADLKPFINLKDEVGMIMISHASYPKITGDNTPATLSKEIITDLLRNKYEYNGLVITDALDMSSLLSNYTKQEIYEKSINAGVDLLLVPIDTIDAIFTIEDLVEEGKISEDRIDESVRRILIYKYTNIKSNLLDKSYLNKDEYNDYVS